MLTRNEKRARLFWQTALFLCLFSYVFCWPGFWFFIATLFCGIGLFKDLRFEILDFRVKCGWCLLFAASINILQKMCLSLADGTNFDARYTGFLIASVLWVYSANRYCSRIAKKLDLCRYYLIEKSELVKSYPTNSLYLRFFAVLWLMAIVELVRIIEKITL